jgi:hypothetical protein
MLVNKATGSSIEIFCAKPTSNDSASESLLQAEYSIVDESLKQSFFEAFVANEARDVTSLKRTKKSKKNAKLRERRERKGQAIASYADLAASYEAYNYKTNPEHPLACSIKGKFFFYEN